MAVERVRVEVHLRVEADHVALARDDERIDLEHAHVFGDEGLVELVDQRHALLHLIALKTERIGDLAPVKAADARRRINIEAQNLFRRLLRHFLDVHAAFGGNDEGDARGGAVNQNGKVEFAVDGGTFLDIEAVHFLAVGTRLVRHERRPEKPLCFLLDVFNRLHDLDATRLAAAARMDLRLDDPDRPAEFVRFRNRLFRCERRMSARYRHAILRKHGLGLVFVNIHEKPSGWMNGAGARGA